jgi:hypothetical protein
MLLAALLSSCAPAPSYCTASARVDVYDGIPSATNNPNVVDWLEPGQETIVTARVDGWYEITRLVSGHNAQAGGWLRERGPVRGGP